MAGFLDALPGEVAEAIQRRLVAQFATVSAAGVPIDTPTVYFIGNEGQSLDLATGIAYPAKAERARRNPKVGLLIEGTATGPVIAVSGLATVRDADLQANLDRYLAETVLITGMTQMTDWSVNRQAIWYYTRIFVCITPVHVRWWANPAAMDQPPMEWRAPPGTHAPPSDTAPAGRASTPPNWSNPPWTKLARAALDRRAPGHLTLLDSEGFPAPIGVREARLVDDGLRLDVPRGVPWTEGKASLSFGGAEMFVGDAAHEGPAMKLNVKRALPLFPLTADPAKVLRPDTDTKAALMLRLEAEVARRGQSIPNMPERPPEPTAGALLRAGRNGCA